MTVNLFDFVAECGCAAKVPAQQLAGMLSDIDLPASPPVLVGPDTLDDAGVYQLSAEQCLVQTVGFFPPVARDPEDYGRIATANALSDVYAMGGRPLTALAVVCLPAGLVRDGVLRAVTRGAAEKLREAGCVLLGGHSVLDPQAKFGLAVTGVIHPREVFTNAKARPGDVLVLTKPLGTGVIIMAVRAGMASKPRCVCASAGESDPPHGSHEAQSHTAHGFRRRSGSPAPSTVHAGRTRGAARHAARRGWG